MAKIGDPETHRPTCSDLGGKVSDVARKPSDVVETRNAKHLQRPQVPHTSAQKGFLKTNTRGRSYSNAV